ncbi:hypothetical protein COV16_05330 [Candidatus Woesearchaeota archaeon CG10_big_fil_rev_8_21_14_0_10_34_8]|nr:MAG: hypothetical protein COV16_05330 [Candidatus Woesearchaeota archaeon CG10_big_fil_rev_8_21_14_0_10_34_8]
MFVLDTNVLIEVEKHNKSVICFLQGLTSRYPSKPYITAPTYSEFLYGFLKHSSKKEEQAKQFLEVYEILHTTKNSSYLLAKLKLDLEKHGKAIPIFDLFIASIVLDKKATFITMDSHFKNIKDLDVMIVEN